MNAELSIDAPSQSSQPTATIRAARSFDDIVACLRVRVAVFVDEQGVPLDEEVDEYDRDAAHYCAEVDGQIVGTARFVPLDPSMGKIGRVAVLRPFRDRGIASALMRAILDGPASGRSCVILDSQEAAVAFYERFGFVAEGDTFLDAGIPHRRMLRRTQTPGGA